MVTMDGHLCICLLVQHNGTPHPTTHIFNPFLTITHVSEEEHPQRKRKKNGSYDCKHLELTKFNTSLLPTSEAAISCTKVKKNNSSSMFQTAPQKSRVAS